MIHCIIWNRINVCDKLTHQCTAIASYHGPRLDRGDTVRGSLPAGANANAKMPRDPDGFNTISPFVGFWILGARIAIVLGHRCGRCISGVRAVLGSEPVLPQELSIVCPLPVSSW